MRPIYIVLIVLLLIATSCGTGVAVPWFTDNFDNYEEGSLAGKPADQPVWTGPSGSVRIQTEFAKWGMGKAGETNYRKWGTGEIQRNVSSGGGYQYIDFDAAKDTSMDPAHEAPEINFSYISIRGQSGSSTLEITRFYYAHQQFKILTGPQPGAQTIILSDVTNRSWHHIRLGIDLTNSKLDVWVDGNQIVTQQPTINSASSITRINIAPFSGITPSEKFIKSEAYFDNIVCAPPFNPPAGQATKIISPTEPWGGWERFNVCYPSVIYDAADGIYRMYYSGSTTGQINDCISDQWQTGIATSTDTQTWIKRKDDYEPVLYAHKYFEGDVIDPEEASSEFDSIFAIGPCVIKDGSTYKMWYTGWNGDFEKLEDGTANRIHYRIGYATSTDGMNWTKHSGSAGAGSIFAFYNIGQESKSVAHPHILKETDGTYHMWYEAQGNDSIWRILHATSSDGFNWTREGLAIGTRKNGSYDALGARNPVVVKRNGKYEMWYQGIGDSAYRNCHVLRATSTNGSYWTKVIGEVALHPDPAVIGNERYFVDSVIVLPNNNCQVFYTKENTINEQTSTGIVTKGSYNIYREVVQ